MVRRLVRTPYSCVRLNESTFRIIHNDKYNEHPFIYAKAPPGVNVFILIDTGCGPQASASPDTIFNDLRQFIEEYPVAVNGGLPLNPGTRDQRRPYLVITTHVHYDHIGGLESFAELDTTRVVSSGSDRSFIEPLHARLKHSLCDVVGMPLPKYTIHKYAQDGENLYWPLEGGKDDAAVQRCLGLTSIHTPGHTPDSLAILDKAEGHLYTGDTFYLRKCTLPGGISFRQPIMFGVYSSLGDFWTSMRKMENEAARATEIHGISGRLKINCAHTTSNVPAANFLLAVRKYMERLCDGNVPIKYGEERGGLPWALWQDPGDPEFSVLAPESFLTLSRSKVLDVGQLWYPQESLPCLPTSHDPMPYEALDMSGEDV